LNQNESKTQVTENPQTMIPKVRMTKKWPQKTLHSFIFQNHGTISRNQIQHKQKATNNTNIGAHFDQNSLNQDESKTQVTDNPQIENNLEHKKLSESHFAKLCLKSLSMDVLVLCKENQLKTGIDMTDVVDNSRDDDTMNNSKNVKRKIWKNGTRGKKITSRLKGKRRRMNKDGNKQRTETTSFFESIASAVSRFISPISRTLYVGGRRSYTDNEPQVDTERKSWMKAMLQNSKIVNEEGEQIIVNWR
jgi:hypothetical protein